MWRVMPTFEGNYNLGDRSAIGQYVEHANDPPKTTETTQHSKPPESMKTAQHSQLFSAYTAYNNDVPPPYAPPPPPLAYPYSGYPPPPVPYQHPHPFGPGPQMPNRQSFRDECKERVQRMVTKEMTEQEERKRMRATETVEAEPKVAVTSLPAVPTPLAATETCPQQRSPPKQQPPPPPADTHGYPGWGYPPQDGGGAVGYHGRGGGYGYPVQGYPPHQGHGHGSVYGYYGHYGYPVAYHRYGHGGYGYGGYGHHGKFNQGHHGKYSHVYGPPQFG